MVNRGLRRMSEARPTQPVEDENSPSSNPGGVAP